MTYAIKPRSFSLHSDTQTFKIYRSITGRKAEVVADIYKENCKLADDIAELVDMFCYLFNADLAGLRPTATSALK